MCWVVCPFSASRVFSPDALRTACALKRRPEGAAQTLKFGSAEGEARLVQHVLSFDNSAGPPRERASNTDLNKGFKPLERRMERTAAAESQFI